MSTRSPHPSFLGNLSSIWAHSHQAPYTATFEHGIPGPAHRVRSECLWYPPHLPASPTISPLPLTVDPEPKVVGGSKGKLFIDTNMPCSAAPDAQGRRGTGKGQGPGVCIMLFIPGIPIYCFYLFCFSPRCHLLDEHLLYFQYCQLPEPVR